MSLLDEARAVASGRKLPMASSAEFSLAALSWAESVAESGESVMEAHERLTLTSPVLRALRIAAGMARMFEGDGNPDLLLVALGLRAGDDDFRSRKTTWDDLIELASSNRRDSETLGDTLRRLVDRNTAARCAFFYVITR